MTHRSPLDAGAAGLLALGLALAPGLARSAEDTVLAPVTVHGASSMEMRRNASAATLVFDREELDRLDSSSVAELLRKLPGTGVFADMENRRGRGRGPDRNMPQILVDGQALPGGERNPMAALRLPVELIERVEIIRSSTPEFPVTGTAGIINLVLRSAPQARTAGLRAALGTTGGDAIERLEGNYGDRIGSMAYLLGLSFQSNPINAAQTTNLQRFDENGRSQWTRELIRDDGRENNLFLSPRFNWNLGAGRQFSLSPFFLATDSQRTTHLDRLGFSDPRAGSGLAFLGRDLEQEDGHRQSSRVTAEWKASGAAGSEWVLRLTAQNENEDKTKQVARFDALGAALGTQLDKTRREEREVGTSLKGKQLLAESHLVSGALEWRSRDSDEWQDHQGSGVEGDVRNTTAHLGERRQVAWIQDEWQLSESHLLTPGLRWQKQGNSVAGSQGAHDHDFQSLDPSLNYLWQVSPRLNLRASMALNGRPPNTRDLSPVTQLAAGINTISTPDRAGNPNLTAERIRSMEAGAEWFLAERAGTVGLSVYHRQISSQIQRLVVEEGGRWVERPYNVGDAQVTGGLIDFKARMDAIALPRLTLRGNYSYSHTRLENEVAGLGAGEGVRQGGNLGFDQDLPSARLTLTGNFSYSAPLARESSARIAQVQGVRRQLDLSLTHRIDRQLNLKLSASNVLKETRGNALQQVDSSGQLIRQENDLERSFRSLVLAVEAKW